ncbi:MAG TPA: FecR domain-containing protein [Steroidobacteraceae bacterium]|nr:FecR domain-containing protein [Steroidobacteraceae bacterium]
MSEIVKLRTRADIDEEAAVWIWRMDSTAVAASDRQAFEAWLRQDPRHRRAAAALSAVWSTLDGLAEAKRDEKIATFTNTAKLPLLHYPQRWWFAAAAVLAAVAVGAIWLQQGSGESQTLATAVGQQRNVTLADGSTVTLNTNTILETDLRWHTREIYLRKGEAHFQVAHDRSRPFLVHAGDAVVRAVGTAFEVRVLTDQHVDVVVDEGRVEVQATALLPASPGPAARIRAAAATTVRALNAGERLSTASRDYAVTPITAQQMSSELAWREGAIVFDGQPLSEAIAEIERYTDARIVVSDPEIARLRVGGRFRTGDVQEFFDALQTALPVSIRHTNAGLVFIDPRP